jgi:GNAT superfamily N-acetyltransferase
MPYRLKEEATHSFGCSNGEVARPPHSPKYSMREFIQIVENTVTEVQDADASIFTNDMWRNLRMEGNKSRYQVIGKAQWGLEVIATQPLDRAVEVYLLDSKGQPVVYLAFSKVGVDDVREINTVMTDPQQRGLGYAYILYEWMLDQGMSLLSDSSQTDGGRGIWAKLFRDGYPMFVWDNSTTMKPVEDIYLFYSMENDRRLLVRPRGSQPLSEVYEIDAGNFTEDSWSSVPRYFQYNRDRTHPIGEVRGYRIVSAEPLDRATELFLVSPEGEPIAYLDGNFTAPDVWVVNAVMTDPRVRGQGFAYILYEWMLNQGISLASDDSQTPGGKAIWAKLFRDGYPTFVWGSDGRQGEPVEDIREFYSARNDDRLLVRPKK